jgi:hypothetical protein
MISPIAATILHSGKIDTYDRCTIRRPPDSGIYFGGTLNKTMNVYVNEWASDDEPVLIGFRGSNFDAPTIYCPYIPVLSGGIRIDLQNFTPTDTFITKYAMITTANAAAYLAKVAINADTLTFV